MLYIPETFMFYKLFIVEGFIKNWFEARFGRVKYRWSARALLARVFYCSFSTKGF